MRKLSESARLAQLTGVSERTGERMAQRRELPPETLGLRFKMARVRAGMTLKDLERATGYAESVLSRYERDKAMPPSNRLARIAAALGITPNDLLDGLDWSMGRNRIAA